MTRVIRDPILEFERSKVKVTRPLNTVTENQSYLCNGKAYELQTWYTDGV